MEIPILLLPPPWCDDLSPPSSSQDVLKKPVFWGKRITAVNATVLQHILPLCQPSCAARKQREGVQKKTLAVTHLILSQVRNWFLWEVVICCHKRWWYISKWVHLFYCSQEQWSDGAAPKPDAEHGRVLFILNSFFSCAISFSCMNSQGPCSSGDPVLEFLPEAIILFLPMLSCFLTPSYPSKTSRSYLVFLQELFLVLVHLNGRNLKHLARVCLNDFIFL